MNASSPDLAIAFYCVIAGSLGIIANGVLLSLIVFNKDLRRKDYIRFILSRTLADLVYSVIQATVQPAVILLSDSSSNWCAAAGFLDVYFGMCSAYSEPLLACNRYISIFHSNIYKNVYSTRHVNLMCVAAWVLGLATSVPHLFVGSLGRTTGSVCSFKFAPETMLAIVLANFTTMFAGIAAILFFNVRMFSYINKYQNQPMTNSQRTQLQNDREMLRFIFMVAIFPMVFQLPTIIVLWMRMSIPVSDWIMFVSVAIFIVASILNPLITLRMVRPIRNQLVAMVKRLMGRHVSTVQVEPTGQQNSQIAQVSGNVLIKVGN